MISHIIRIPPPPPRPFFRRGNSSKSTSAHAQWYTHIVPPMIPIFLLGSATYLGLQLTQLKLSHERFLSDADARVKAIEAEIGLLQQIRAQKSQRGGVTTTPITSRWW